MKIFNRFLIVAAFFFLFTPFHSTSADITKTPYVHKDIKNDYCGVKVQAKFCKCAWHNQLCEAAGMDQASAVNFVTSGFNNWEAGIMKGIADQCNSSPAAYWKDGVCVSCSPPHYNQNNNCVLITDLCGDDPQVKWNYESKQCACPDYWDWDSREKKCVEQDVIQFEIEVLDDLPALADGKSTVDLTAFATDIRTKSEVPLTIALKSNNSIQGSLTGTGDDPSLYARVYTAPDLSGLDPSDIKADEIIFTYTDEEGSSVSKNISIGLFNGTRVRVSHAGFETIEVVVPFESDTADIEVLGAGKDITTFPIAGALIETTAADYRTDSDGTVTITSPKPLKNQGAVRSVKVFLTLDSEIEALQAKAMDKYLQTGIKNETVENYIRYFGKNIASVESPDAQKASVDSLKRIEYSMFYIKKGNEMGEVSAKNMAAAVKDAVWNVIDSIDSIGDIGELLNVKLLKDFQSFGGQFKDIGGKSIDFVTGKLSGAKNEAWQYVAKTFSEGVRKYAPDYNGPEITGLFDFMLGKFGTESWKLAYDQGTFQGLIEEFFVKEQKVQSQKAMDMVASRITRGDWVPIYGNDWLENSKGNYENLMNKFNAATQTEFTISEIKAFTELGIDTVNTAANFAPQFKAFAKGLDVYYKGVRTAFLDSETMYSWFETSSTIADMTFAASARALGMPSSEWTNPADQRPLFNALPFHFIPFAYAEETDDLESFLNERNQMDETTMNQNVEYHQSQIDAEFYSDWVTAAELLVQLYPEEKAELQELIKDFEGKEKVAMAKVDELKKVVDDSNDVSESGSKKDCGENDLNCDGEVTLADFTLAEWITLAVILIVFTLVGRKIWKVVRRKK